MSTVPWYGVWQAAVPPGALVPRGTGDQGRVGVQVVVSTVDGRSMMRSMADCVPCRAYSPITARINSMDTSHTVSLLILLMCLPLSILDH